MKSITLWLLSALVVAASASAQEDRIRSLEAQHGAALCGAPSGVLNPGAGEVCDSANLDGKTCPDLVPGSTGTLTCSSLCQFNTSGCTVPPPPSSSGGSWVEVPNSRFVDHINCTGVPSCNPDSVLGAWSSAVMDTERNRLIQFGGGHADSWYNGINAFDLDTNTWVNLLPSGPGPIDPNVCANADVNGNPVSRHTYGALAYVPRGSRAADYMMLQGGSRACYGGSFGTDTWLFNLTTNTWEFVGEAMANSPGAIYGGWSTYCGYDTQRDRVYCVTSASGWLSLMTFNATTRSWSTVLPFFSSGASDLNGSSAGVIIHKSGHQLDDHFVLVTNSQPQKLVAVNLANPVFQFLDLLGTFPATVEGYGLDWNGSKLVAWSGVDPAIPSRSVYEIDGLAVAEKTHANGPAFHAGRWILGKWRYSATSNAFVAVHDANANVWRYNYAAPAPPPPGGNSAARCSAPSVVFCDGLDTVPTQSWWERWQGVSDLSGGAEVILPQADPAIKASGGASMKMTLQPKTNAHVGGDYATNFSQDLSVQLGEGESVFVQFRWRADCAFFYSDCGTTRRAYRAEGGGTTSPKLFILSTGDSVPGVSAPSCTWLEVVGTLGYDHVLGGYHSCGWYEGFQEPLDPVGNNIETQPGGAYDCWYRPDPAGPVWGWANTGPNCWAPRVDEWATFQVGLDIGQWQPDRAGSPTSRVRMWAAHEGQPQELVIDHTLYLRGPESPSERYGKIWLLPYMTGKDSTEDHPTAHIWYDELIVSRDFIADPI